MEWYIIENLDDFVDHVRGLVFNNFGESDDDTDVEKQTSDIRPENQDECDSVLSHNESKRIVCGIVKKQIHKITKVKRYLLTNKMFMTIVEALNERMTSNLLSNLVNKGLIETGFDSSVNDFVFWVKDATDTDTKTPEAN